MICVSILPPEASFPGLGPLTYLAKPFALEALEAAICNALAA